MKKQEQYVDNWIRERTGLGSALTAENLRAWQQERVREAEIYAAEHAAFYRDRKEALLSPEPGQHFFITAEDIRRRPEDFLCVSPKEIARIITIPTSGSTGRPKRIFFTEEDLMVTADFFTPGMAYMTEPGQLVTVFMEGEQVYSIGGLLRIALERREISTRVHGFVHDLKEAEQAAQGADCLVGVPGQMALLAEAAPKLRPKTVLLSGDYVPQSVVRRLESIWECEVFQHWGMTETGYGGGVECGAHCGYHLRDADLMIEIIHPETGESVPNGTWGEVVFSAFARKGMPLLHYRTGDIGRFCPDACGCGGVLPRLDKVMGRIENTIFLHNGDAISIHQLDEVLFALDGVHDYAVKLKQNPEATLSLTIEGDADPDMITEFIHKKWSGLEIRVNSGIVERKRKRSIVREK